ncbi:hypothetical protein ABIA85_009199 [Bradyrhizobium sp. LA6.10]|uniref:hypothetical protein n=1 Tax=Bradyrhizobium sp. LA6.10 TaxID=3156318 RepID=UPI003396F817
MLIAFPNVDDAVRESRIAQKQNPKTQESEVQHPAFLQNRILHQDKFCLFLRSIRILHGRLKNREQQFVIHGEAVVLGVDVGLQRAALAPAL